jgi:transposase
LKPISNDKRLSIIEAKQRKESVETIIKWFNVSAVQSVEYGINTLKQVIIPLYLMWAERVQFLKNKDTEIREFIRNNNDATLEEILESLSINLTVSGLSRRLDKMGLSYKKDTPPKKSTKRKCCCHPKEMARKPRRFRHRQT